MLFMKITRCSSQVLANRPNPGQLGFIKGKGEFSYCYLLTQLEDTCGLNGIQSPHE